MLHLALEWRQESVNQTARDVRGPSPLLAIESESPAKLMVDPPLPGPPSQGHVFIQFWTEYLHAVPVFGWEAFAVLPRIGHLHITVENAPWHFVAASGYTVIVVGLRPGPQKVLFELADPTHHVITRERVAFTIPERPGTSD